MAKPKPFISISLYVAMLTTGSIVQAGSSPCISQPDTPQLAFTRESGTDASFDNEHGMDVALSTQHFQFVSRSDEGVSVDYGHEYTIIDIERLPGAQPSSNGHLHRLYVPIDVTALLPEDWSLRLQPAVSISSNLLKNPEHITRDALQFNVALLKQWNASAASHWRAGICGDYRFGEYRLYPAVSRLWQIDAWSVELGFPDIALDVRLADTLTAGMRLSPDGNRWSIHDEDFRDSLYRYKSWRLDTRIGWRFHQQWQAQLHFGYRFLGHHELVLDDGTRFRGDTDTPWYFAVTLRRYLTDQPRPGE